MATPLEVRLQTYLDLIDTGLHPAALCFRATSFNDDVAKAAGAKSPRVRALFKKLAKQIDRAFADASTAFDDARRSMSPAIYRDSELHVNGQVLRLTDAEAAVVHTLVHLRAVTLDDLAGQSGNDRPAQVVTRLLQKHPVLRAYIVPPGGKGKGGYRVQDIRIESNS
jgi:hypothetical protein